MTPKVTKLPKVSTEHKARELRVISEEKPWRVHKTVGWKSQFHSNHVYPRQNVDYRFGFHFQMISLNWIYLQPHRSEILWLVRKLDALFRKRWCPNNMPMTWGILPPPDLNLCFAKQKIPKKDIVSYYRSIQATCALSYTSWIFKSPSRQLDLI